VTSTHPGPDTSSSGGVAGLGRRPAGVDDDTVVALGKLSEALEWVERARGRLYDFHQLSGHADFLFEEAANALEEAGRRTHAELVRRELIGRNVLDGRWTFQIVEEYDDGYWEPVRRLEREVRTELVAGGRHVHEAELKMARITPGHPRHRPTPE
jgi:hypothetical protein